MKTIKEINGDVKRIMESQSQEGRRRRRQMYNSETPIATM